MFCHGLPTLQTQNLTNLILDSMHILSLVDCGFNFLLLFINGWNFCFSYALFNMFDDLNTSGKRWSYCLSWTSEESWKILCWPWDPYPRACKSSRPLNWHCGGYSDTRWQLRSESWRSWDVIPVSSGMKVHSFAGELWQSMKSNVELQRDKIRLNFLKSKDLTNRRTPGLCQQYKYFVVR